MEFKLRIGRQEVAVRENLVDRAVRYLDPVRARARMAARVQLAIAGGYTGASKTKRSLSQWSTLGGSADADLNPDLSDLRERSRDLLRNSSIAAGAIKTVVTNVVGTGLALHSEPDREVLGWTEEAATKWQREVQREFRLWAESTDCDVTRAQNFYGLQDLAFRSTLENGDVFSLLPFVPRPRRPYELAIQLIESDRVCNKGFAADTDGLSAGVVLDAMGAPVKYQVLSCHPGNLYAKKREWIEIEAYGARTGRRNMLHLFDRLRVGQTRGAPYLAPVIEPLKQLDRYSESELAAAVVSSFFTVAIKAQRGGLNPLDSATTGNTPTGADTPTSDWDGKLSPGLVLELGQDDTVEGINPARPNANFDPFFLAIVRQIGVALQLPYEVLIKHYTSSYTAARAAILDAWRFFRGRREWLATHFCQPVFEAFLEEAVTLRRINAPGFMTNARLRAAYLKAQWVGDAPGSVDPLKEAQASQLNLEINRTTLAKETLAYDGADWEDNLEQRGREDARRKERGLVQTSAPPADGQREEHGTGNDDETMPAKPMEQLAGAIAAMAKMPPPAVHVRAAGPPVTWVFRTENDGTTTATPVQGEEP